MSLPKSEATEYFTLNRNLKDQSAILGHEDHFRTDVDVTQPVETKDEWVLWEQVVPHSNRAFGGSNYGSNLKEIASFDTVQDFWLLWDHLPQPSELLMNKKMISDGPETRQIVDAIMLFKKGIKPMWEDEKNANGGLFEYKFRPEAHNKEWHAQIDELWNNLVLAMVGGCIDPHGMITGVRLVDKLSAKNQGFLRIELWFATYADEDNRNNLKTAIETAMSTRLDGTFHTVIQGETKEFKKQR